MQIALCFAHATECGTCNNARTQPEYPPLLHYRMIWHSDTLWSYMTMLIRAMIRPHATNDWFLLKFLMLAIWCFCFVGCASITGSTTQLVAVTTVCEGQVVTKSSCSLKNDKGQWSVVTPSSPLVHKSYEDLMVVCTNASSSGSASFQSRNNNGVWGNILIGGGIGYVVDAGSGAGFNYPEAVTVVLIPPCPQGAAP